MYIVKIRKKGSTKKKDCKILTFLGKLTEDVREQWRRIANHDKLNEYEVLGE